MAIARVPAATDVSVVPAEYQIFGFRRRRGKIHSVSTLLRHKGNQVFSIPSGASVYSAIELMAEKNVGGLLVIDANRLVGIVSERDYTRRVVLKGRSSKDTVVREIMTRFPITITHDTSVEEAMRIMRDNRIRHVPVVDSEGRAAGVLSTSDLMNWIISSHEQTIEQMERYTTVGLTSGEQR